MIHTSLPPQKPMNMQMRDMKLDVGGSNVQTSLPAGDLPKHTVINNEPMLSSAKTKIMTTGHFRTQVTH